MTAETKETKETKKGPDRLELLYWSGSALIVIGLALGGPDGFERALIAAGCSCLVFPVLGMLSSFVKGIR